MEEKKVKKNRGCLWSVLIVIGIIVVLVCSFPICTSCMHNTSQDEDSSGEVDITHPYETFEWPDSKIVKRLPKPKSNFGTIDFESSSSFTVYVAKTSKDDYDSYVKACQEKGFTVDYNKYSNSFSGNDKDGYSVMTEFLGNDTMYISISEPDEEDSYNNDNKSKSSKVSKASKAKKSKKTTGGVSAKFKKFVDGYEKFMDGYIDFMKKYNANPTDAELLSAYSDWMSDYADWVAKIEDVDEDELSAADAAYYLKVTARVAKKLSKVK